ncbi:MmgE/PrpD family protein [Falsochrobactrum shanghaiense]|nr:MmgE/PrpD family protein [Falsochrobactrum shanghaiense]
MDANVDTLSLSLARWVEALRYEDLPPEVIHHIRRSLLDYLGVAIRGASSRVPRILLQYLVASEGKGGASVLGTDQGLSSANAALANGTAAAALELDDGHAKAAVHLGAVSFPAILATAEERGSTSRDVILAAAAAYEVASRLAMAADRAARRGFNNTPLIGGFAAAAGVAKILGGDARTIAHALGLAGSTTGGLFDYHGGWLDSWCVNTGRTSREGLLCANLAASGIAGPLDIFHGPRGFAVAFTDGEFDGNAVLRSIGQEWRMLETYIKPYPCCRRLHSPIDAVLSLRPKVGDIDAVERIVVETSADSARLDRKDFDSVSAAQMSIPYGVAVALIHGAPTLEHFEADVREDLRIRRLADLVEVRKSDDPDVADRQSSARVSLSIGGVTSGVTVEEPSGNPANPVDDGALEEKFRQLVEPVIGGSATTRLAERVWSFGDVRHEPEEGGELHFLGSLHAR